MYIRVIDKDIEYFRGKDIILFGCGSCGIRALEEFEKAGAHILGFCDNNPELIGKQLLGYSIISPNRLKDHPKADIIITSTYEKEIEQQLIKMQLTNYYNIKLGVLKETIPPEQFNNPVLTPQQVNDTIYKGLISDDPYFIGRLGSVELECLSHYLYFLDRADGKQIPYPRNVKMMMNVNAGFFPTEDHLLDDFSMLYKRDLLDMDLIWSMWFSKYESMIYRDLKKVTCIASYDDTALPHNFNHPWTEALYGKKVLVIHPFEESIKQNYKIRNKLFKNENFLPEFELKTIKAVQSIAGNATEYKDWFEALKSMEHKMDEVDFDIALIGAGAYGLPLGAYAKGLGKKAIHIGGYLQLFFGIKGRAWDKLGIYNEYWTSPKLTETPEGYRKVEAGRYW